MQEALRADSLSKTYSNGVTALDQVSFSSPKGELLTLLGPNGAGKTTLVRIATAQLVQTRGNVSVCGVDVDSNPDKVRRLISLVPQSLMYDPNMTPFEHVSYFLRLEGLSKTKARERTNWALEQVHLQELSNRGHYKMSGGERRRVAIAGAIGSTAEVLFLDEPTASLDPSARQDFWGVLRGIVTNGKNVVLTTHSMDEAEFLSDRVVMLDRGKVVAQGNPQEIKSMVPSKARVVIYGDCIGEDFQTFGETKSFGDRRIVYIGSLDEASRVLEVALRNGLRAEVSPTTLEDAFVKLTGKAT